MSKPKLAATVAGVVLLVAACWFVFGPKAAGPLTLAGLISIAKRKRERKKQAKADQWEARNLSSQATTDHNSSTTGRQVSAEARVADNDESLTESAVDQLVDGANADISAGAL